MKNNPPEQRRLPSLGSGVGAETGTTCWQRNKVDTPPQPGGDMSDCSDAGEREATKAGQMSCDSQLRRRIIHQLEKEKLEMTSTHNQQLCSLKAELARLRSSVEQGEAQRAELQYQLAVSKRDAERAHHTNATLTDQAAALQQTVQELHKVLDMIQQARKEDQHALQQEVDERDALIDRLTSESERLHCLLQCQEETLEVAERRMMVLQKEQEKEVEAALAVECRNQQEAECKLEQLQGELREAKRERRERTEHALQQLQTEHEQCKFELSVALETERRTTFELTAVLEEEKSAHANTHLLLEQAVKREVQCRKVLEEIREALQQHMRAGCVSPKDDGKQSPSDDVMRLLKSMLRRQVLADRQVQDLLLVCERLHEEKQMLQELTVDQKRCLQESRHLSLKLQEEVTRLREESCDWSTQKEEVEKDKEEMSKRLMVGRTLLLEHRSMSDAFTWEELCDVINQQVEQLTSNRQEANNKVAHLQSVCEEMSACMQDLQRNHECVLARMEESVRMREEARNSRHAHELQVNRSECRSLRDRVDSLTSDLLRLHDYLSRSRKKSSSFLSACALLAGMTVHTELRLRSLSEQKRLLVTRLAAREELEEELRRLAGALGGDEEEGGGQRSQARRRWRKYVCVLSAVRRWRDIAKRSPVLFWLDRAGCGPAVCVSTATLMGQDGGNEEDVVSDGGRDAACVRWLRSKSLSSAILSCMADLQGALASTPPAVMPAARSGLSRLLDQLVKQPASGPEILDQMKLSRQSRPLSSLKTLVSGLQQYFLLFSQRLHSAEVERRSLRLQVAQLRRVEQREGDTCRTVPAHHFHSVCTELRQALSREQEAHNLVQEQSMQLDALRLQVNTHTAEQADSHHALSQMAETLAGARRCLRGKERSLRVLARRLSRAQKERYSLRGCLRRADEQLQDANRPQDHVISYENVAEQRYKELTGSLIQSLPLLSAEPCPLALPVHHVATSGAESIMGKCQVSDVQTLPAPSPPVSKGEEMCDES
ncbi:coiled-coil domain-containing protein 171-like isoform X2 [Dunckerocampus dactyliophorus]|uniref:coiled-coil domain-containing protein 171-like isoform X2 n=1 Tax=Dunckerocampus dactyliophorus TaxID=161453 RepID=UPI002405B511|nr:coiled-coil domain-containing protein 171-like isoform X2 [Dunckerocampus dactyliophorus]